MRTTEILLLGMHELGQEYNLATGKSNDSAAAACSEAAMTKLWPWCINKIWIKNETGEDVTVFVDRYFTIEKVKNSIEVKSGASGDIWDAAVAQGLVQMDVLAQCGKSKTMFTLGSGPGGGFVTAALTKDRTKLVCKNLSVPGGQCLVLRSPTFNDSVLSPAEDLETDSMSDCDTSESFHLTMY